MEDATAHLMEESKYRQKPPIAQLRVGLWYKQSSASVSLLI